MVLTDELESTQINAPIDRDRNVYPTHLEIKNKKMKLTRTVNYPNGYLLIAPIVSSKPQVKTVKI